MNRTCPKCHGANVRRSSTPAAEITWRNQFFSRYRCRDCLTQFWAISRKTYTAAGVFAGAIALAVIGVFVLEAVFNRQSDPPAPKRRRAEAESFQPRWLAAASAIARPGFATVPMGTPAPAQALIARESEAS